MKIKGNIYRRLIPGLLIFFIVVPLLDSCTKTNDNKPGANEVFIQGMSFVPVSITVSAGTTVTWINKDAVNHTVTSNTGLFDSGTIPKNGSYTHTFSSAGTFPYHCTIHPTMNATVVVQ